MKYGRNVGPSVSFTSSDSSGSFNRTPNKHLVLQDPQLNIEIPIYVIIPIHTPISGNYTLLGKNSLISLRRGLLLLKTISFLNDPKLLEWKSVLKIISESIDRLKNNSRSDISSSARWDNIVKYLSRSRRFISWVKIMKALNILKDEFPEIEVQSKSVFNSIKDLLEGTSRLAIKNSKTWDEDMREIPK
jgi:hypothetical protein